MGNDIDRRAFLKHTAGVVVSGAALDGSSPAPSQSGAPAPAPPPDVDALTTDRCGADCMVDVVKSIDLEYICANIPLKIDGRDRCTIALENVVICSASERYAAPIRTIVTERIYAPVAIVSDRTDGKAVRAYPT